MAFLLGFLGVLGFSFSLLGRAVVAAALGAVLLAVLRQPRPSRRMLGRLALVGGGVVVGFPLFTALALRELSSAHGAVIVGLLPAATAAMAVVRAGEHPSPGFWLATGAGLAAVVAFAATQGAGGVGALARELGGWQTICWALLLSMPVVAPLAVAAAVTGDLSGGTDAWLGFAYVSLVSMFLGFFAWYAGLARGGVAKTGQVQLAQPVLTLGWSAALLGEEVSAATIAAALAVLLSVAATQRTRVDRARRSPAGPSRTGPESETSGPPRPAPAAPGSRPGP